MTKREKEQADILFYNLDRAIVKLEYKRDYFLGLCGYNENSYYWDKANQIDFAIIKIKRFKELMYSQLVLGSNHNVF
jgi:hypothetical protein